jgi:hypothetical protein
MVLHFELFGPLSRLFAEGREIIASYRCPGPDRVRSDSRFVRAAA